MEILKQLLKKHLKTATIVIAVGSGVFVSLSVVDGEVKVDVQVEDTVAQ